MKNQRLGFATFLLLFSLMLSSSTLAFAGRNLYNDVRLGWGGGRCQIRNNGELLTATLDKTSGSGFESKDEYLFVKLDMQIKLVRGDSAGTVTTYYVRLLLTMHDSFRFGFLV